MVAGPMLVSIEGNVGSGKSTVLDVLEKQGFTVVKEPIEHWSDTLRLFYTDPKKYSFLLQTRILTELVRVREKALASEQQHKDNVIFFERSQQGAKVFVEVACRNGDMNDVEQETYFRLEETMFEARPRLRANQRHVLIVTPPTTCCERIVRRNRSSEQSGPLMSTSDQKLLYVQQLHEMHETLFPKEDHARVCGLQVPEAVAQSIVHSLYIPRAE